MPALIVKHYANTAMGSNGEATLQLQEPALLKETVAFGSQSSAFVAEWIAIQGDENFKVAFAATPGAGDLANEFVMPAGGVLPFRVQQGWKLFVDAA